MRGGSTKSGVKRGLGSVLLVGAAAALSPTACSAPSKGSLMLAISTDMQTPKDVSLVSVFVAEGSTVKFDYIGRVLPDGTLSLPATLALVEPDNPSTQIQVRVVGFQEQTARVLRDVLTTVPHERTALLRIPLDFIDDGSGIGTLPMQFYPTATDGVAEGVTAFYPGAIASKCDPMQLCEKGNSGCKTMIDGQCASATIDSSTLPAYTPAQVFGDAGVMANGEPASCFDVTSCFAAPTPVAVGVGTCGFPLPSSAGSVASFNLALVSPSTGECLRPGECLVPLPDDPSEGWTVQGGTVTLAPGVCAKLGPQTTLAWTSGACSSDTASESVCEPAAEGADAGESADSSVATDGTVAESGASSAESGAHSEGGAPGFDATVGPTGDAAEGDASSVPCPSGLQCDVSCSAGTTTTVSGTVYDPAGRDPLYNVVVYVPSGPLEPVPQGVPTGADACSCDALYKTGAVTATVTGIDGTFTLMNVPVGANVPLVIQVGKWRRLFQVNVSACQNNAQASGTLTFPSTVASGDTNDSMPEIAVSTGSADTLECLMLRMGIDASEYVAGAASSGHVHIFSGGLASDGGTSGTVGMAESPPMAGAPASYSSLWSTQAQLMPYDIVLLSCEGAETYNANPPALEGYLNAGGRVFASHYHYSWFAGPLASSQEYAAPADWGTNLATWTANGTSSGGGTTGPIGGTIVTTLNGSASTFPKGMALSQWLSSSGALGQDGVPTGELSIYQPRYNAEVGASNTASQPWITSSPWTMYFSFDTPVNAAPASDGGAPAYCGRAVFSDLHVSGNPATTDTPPPPTGCETGALSPQEKALEFMLFDLSSCVIPDSQTPSGAVGVGL